MQNSRRIRRALLVAAIAVTTLTAGSVAPAPAAAASPTRVAPAATTAWFISPSGNIGCWMDTNGARCDALRHSYPVPTRPSTCKGDWGMAMEVTRSGKGHFLCVFDSVAGASKVLAYGHAKTIGRFTCTSRTNGITCVNTRNGHGFRIARASYRRF